MRVVDILIATLVLYPWLTQGVPVEIAGYSFDLADLGVPLLIVALITHAVQRGPALGMAAAAPAALFLLIVLSLHLTHGTGAALATALFALAARHWSGEPWEKSFFLRLGSKLARRWLLALERSPGLALWSVAAIVGAQFFSVSLLRHWAFETHGHDLGIYTNAIWNLTHGNGYVSAVKNGQNLFLDHQAPLYWALAPLFWLVPRPETLLCLQAFGLAAGGPALFYLGRRHFGRGHWASAALPWLYWSYLPLRNANAFDFHPEFMMWPLFLWAFAGFATRTTLGERTRAAGSGGGTRGEGIRAGRRRRHRCRLGFDELGFPAPALAGRSRSPLPA